MKEINDFLLNLFTGTDESRPDMMFPNTTNGIVYATDTHVIISIPENELSLKYSSNDSFPNCHKIIEEFEQKKLSSVKVSVADLAKELTKARIYVDKNYVECKECNGSGLVGWEYEDKDGKTHYLDEDCPICDGIGRIDKSREFARVSLNMIENKSEFIGINVGDLYFHPFQLYRLFMVAVIKGYSEIEIFYDTEIYGKTLAYFGNIKILVMLMLNL